MVVSLNSIAGVIVAGGTGARVGGRKPLMTFGSGVLIDSVIARARPQVSLLALNVPATDEDDYRERYGSQFPLLRDPFDARMGPLGGILAGLEWLRGRETLKWLASFPCDTPFLPTDLVEQLCDGANAETPKMAMDREQVHGICAVWPSSCGDRLRAGLERGTLRSMISALEALGGQIRKIACNENAFFNVNTAQDIERARQISMARDTP